MGQVGHFQIAGVPERHEPDTGELNYPYLFNVIAEVSNQCNWQGWVGCEYRPRKGGQADGTSAGLGWLHNAQKDPALNKSLPSYTRASRIGVTMSD